MSTESLAINPSNGCSIKTLEIMASFDRLPDEIVVKVMPPVHWLGNAVMLFLLQILNELHIRDLCLCLEVCHRWEVLLRECIFKSKSSMEKRRAKCMYLKSLFFFGINFLFVANISFGRGQWLIFPAALLLREGSRQPPLRHPPQRQCQCQRRGYEGARRDHVDAIHGRRARTRRQVNTIDR